MTTEREDFTEGVIKSLCFLYQEALRERFCDMEAILETAIEDTERAAQGSIILSEKVADTLKQFYILRSFKKLDDGQKQQFIRALEEIQSDSRVINLRTVKN